MKFRHKKTTARSRKVCPRAPKLRNLRGARLLVTQHLAMLGLQSYLEEAMVDDYLAQILLPTTSIAIDTIRFAPPRLPQKYLLIQQVLGTPDPAGWIFDFHRLVVPYWVPKRELGRLRAIETTLKELGHKRFPLQ